jgi:glycosyltransferase involved in cell wall biosynthesis
MKILQIVTQMEAAGAQRVAYLLSRQLADRGHHSELLFLYVKRPAYAQTNGVSALLDRNPSLIDCFRIAVLLAIRLCTNRPDVIITHTHYSNILGQTIACLCGVRCRIAVNHSLDTLYSPVARFFDRMLGALGLYSKVVAVSSPVAESLQNYPTVYRSRLCVIPNGVEVTHPTLSVPAARKLWSLPTDAPLLGTVGRLSKTKNHAFLIDILDLVPLAHLAILGDGEERQALESLITRRGLQERVHLLGEQPSDVTNGIVASCDVFLFPSLLEAMPMALIEAMLLASPIIASDIDACADVLGSSGLCLRVSDGGQWAAAIKRLLESPQSGIELGRSAKSKANEFTPSRMADAYLKVIDNLQKARV